MAKFKLSEITSLFIHYEDDKSLDEFIQFNIYKNIKITCKQGSDCEIKAISGSLEVESCKIVYGMKGRSIEGQNLTGCNLVIIGRLNVKITYVACKICKNVCLLEDFIPFSTFIVIDGEICEVGPINLKYLIEDLEAIIIDKNNILVTSTLLIKYDREYC